MIKIKILFLDIIQYLVQLVQYPVSQTLLGLLSHGIYLVSFQVTTLLSHMK